MRTKGKICCFQLILEIYRKLRNNDSLITKFYFVIIYRECHKNDLHAITSRLIFGNKNPDVHLRGKGSKKEKNYKFHFRREIDLYYHFHAT